MLSEEAKPQIAERADVGCTGYDIWWAHINALRRSYTWNRQAIYGETRYLGDRTSVLAFAHCDVSWFYSLDDDMHCGSKCPGNKVINPTPYATGLNDGMRTFLACHRFNQLRVDRLPRSDLRGVLHARHRLGLLSRQLVLGRPHHHRAPPARVGRSAPRDLRGAHRDSIEVV